MAESKKFEKPCSLELEVLGSREATVARIVYTDPLPGLRMVMPVVGEGTSKVHPRDENVPRLGRLLAVHRALLNTASNLRKRIYVDYGFVLNEAGGVILEAEPPGRGKQLILFGSTDSTDTGSSDPWDNVV